ncbi:SDR family NAD(P)-dependent oxidoreductase [Streptomyces sp. NPDC001922]|uniref:SDR family NAD(P)-dependent oxidoreductase n=1 Tax=Streptomyces sp. NPDC001922 TaxID=3364624 RepID=UPI00368F8B5C
MPYRSRRPSAGGAVRPVALITGASSGIGAAVAARIAAEGGWRLLLNGRDEERLTAVAQETSGIPLPTDLTDPRGREWLAARALHREGRVDALIAGAGIGWAGPFTRMPAGALDAVLSVNLSAALHLVRLVLPGMVARGTGHIVLIGSMAGCVGVREEAVYAAAKGGLMSFAESLRYELARTGVRVSMILPGAVDTPFFTRRGVPYHRNRPRPVPASRVADAVWSALAAGRDDAFVPPWLALPARVHGLAPGVFRALARRFG